MHKDVTVQYSRIVEYLLRTRTVQALADELGVTRQTVHAWKRGRRPYPAERDALVTLLLDTLPRARVD